MVEGKTHEEITHEKLVTRLSRLRNAASEAVLWDDRDKLVHVAKAFTCITPTKRAIAEKGVGHLLADKTVWVKGGDVALSLAKKALTDWKEKVKHTVCDRQLTVTGRRPLVTMNARLYMDYVNDLVDCLKTVDEVPVDPVCSKKLAATLVQHGILHWRRRLTKSQLTPCVVRNWLQPWCNMASSIGNTSTPLAQSPCKCYIRHRLRCSAARQPKPHSAGGMWDQCSKIVALKKLS